MPEIRWRHYAEKKWLLYAGNSQKVDDHRMTFTGYVIDEDENLQPIHYAQVWVIKQLGQADEE
jgi:hypothetical protein